MKALLLGVTYTLKPETRDLYMKEILASDLLPKIHAEEGCLGYDYFFPTTEENQIFLMEKWDSAEHQEVHLAQPHMTILKEIKEKYVTDTKVEKFTICD